MPEWSGGGRPAYAPGARYKHHRHSSPSAVNGFQPFTIDRGAPDRRIKFARCSAGPAGSSGRQSILVRPGATDRNGLGGSMNDAADGSHRGLSLSLRGERGRR